MIDVRRWYIYLVSAVSLQAVAWAAIDLLRRLLANEQFLTAETTAARIALILIGLPVYLVHWLWAERLARQSVEERQAVVRRLYLYGMMAGFLAPLVGNAYKLLRWLLEWLFPGAPRPTATALTDSLTAIAVLALLWLYHYWRTTREVQAVAGTGTGSGTPGPIVMNEEVADSVGRPAQASILETGYNATVRRVYVFGFSAAGLFITALGAVGLLQWLLETGESIQFLRRPTIALPGLIARLVVGAVLWLVFWLWMQRLFRGPAEEEHTSTLRKFYLYAATFVAALAAITAAAVVISDALQRSLQVAARIQVEHQPLATLIVVAIAWAYHAYVLGQDARLAADPRQQAGILRLCGYLTAGLGLAALLIGVAGDFSVLLRSLAGARYPGGLDLETAWYTAALLIGLVVWTPPWYQAQRAASAPSPMGIQEIRSLTRRLYLYFFLFLATMTILAAAVVIVARLVRLVLGLEGADNLLGELAQAIAFSLVALGVWAYHGYVLRQDGRRIRAELAARQQALLVTVVDPGDGRLGRALVAALRSRLPHLRLQPIGLTPTAAAVLGAGADQLDVPATLRASQVIIGPWTIARTGGAVSEEVARAVADSPAHKLLLPVEAGLWRWVGVGQPDNRRLVQEAVEVIGRLAAGEPGRPALGIGAAIAALVGLLIVAAAVAIPLLRFFTRL